jgi:hypothetical protein
MKKNLLLAMVATLIFWMLTFRTGYPFLADDHRYLVLSYRPDFGLRDFIYMLSRRPLSTVVSFIGFKYHLFEKTKLLFPLFFFLHSLGVIGIFRYCLDLLGSDEIKRFEWPVTGLAVLACLYPCWFEINLMALDLSWGLGVPLLALSLHSKKAWARWLYLFASFLCLETYFLPALALFILEATVHGLSKERLKRNFFIWGSALALYLVIQKALTAQIASTEYGINFHPASVVQQGLLYFRLLWTQSFYKTNWVSTALEILTVAGVSAWMIAHDRKHWKLVVLVFAVPVFSAGHSVIMSYYAPRAIHGAMVLKAVLIALLLAEFARQYRGRIVPAAAAALIAAAYVGHYLLIVSNRSYNHSIMEAREHEIETQLEACTSPCTIDARHLNADLRWDWYLPASFAESFVIWIKERDGIDKQVIVLRPQ